MELLNLNTHLHLRSLRTPPGQPRKFPTGLGFGQVVCANYWFEILGIIGMIIMTSGDFGRTSTHFILKMEVDWNSDRLFCGGGVLHDDLGWTEDGQV